MPTALVMLVISTPVEEEITTSSIAVNLRNNAEIANRRARAIENLETMGWTLLRRPEVVQTDTHYQDFIAYWRKDLADPDEAERDMRAAGAFEGLNFSLLWGHRDDAPDHDDDLGSPNHEWGGEGPSERA